MICLPPGARVLLVGDSFAVGLAPHLSAQAKACGHVFSAHASEGTSVVYWSSLIGTILKSDQPTVVLVSLGGNDYGRNDPDTVQAAIGELVRKVDHAGARLVRIRPLSLPFPDKIGVEAMWTAMSVPTYPSELLTIARGDGIHPNGAGYKHWAEQIWPWLAELLTPPPPLPARPPGVAPASTWPLAVAIVGLLVLAAGVWGRE